ncbi:unnamed protein product [Peniophora sp. CBMAI 1063]|nr:unnamed protein product [Peniophora sp. CBMAI 1063]
MACGDRKEIHPGFDFVSWQTLIAHLERLQFPTWFIGEGEDAPDLLSELPIRIKTSSSSPRQRSSAHWVLIVCGDFEWDVSPDPDNIAKLADALQYKVPIDGSNSASSVSGTLASTSLEANTSKPEKTSIRTLFDRHSRDYHQSRQLLYSNPRAFLDVGLTIVKEYGIRLDNVQFCDWLDIVGNLFHPLPSDRDEETAVRIQKELPKEELLEIYSRLLEHLHIPYATYRLVDMTQDLMAKAREDISVEFSEKLGRLLDELWLKLWSSHEHLTRDGTAIFLVYHSRVIDAYQTRSSLLHLFLRYIPILMGESKGSVAIYHNPGARLATCRIVLLCWMYPVLEVIELPGAEHFAMDFVLRMFSKRTHISGLTQSDLDRFVKVDILGNYGAGAFLVQLAHALLTRSTYKVRTDEAYDHQKEVVTLLTSMTGIIVQPEFRTYYSYSGILDAITSVFDTDRYMLYSSDEQCLLRYCVAYALREILRTVPISQAAKPLVRSYGIMSFLAQSFVCFTQAGSDVATGNGIDLLVEIMDVYAVIAKGAKARGNVRDDKLIHIITTSIKAEWYPAIHDLKRIALREQLLAPKCHLLLGSWLDLGSTLGLQEKDEQEAFETEMRRVSQFCAWTGCKFHEERPPTATRACGGCGEVRYCSRECQQKGWKQGGHKLRCKRLKSEPHAARKT